MTRVLRTAALAVLVLAAASCTKPGKTREVLEQQGYTKVEIQGYGWFDCSEDDAFATAFTATAPNGQPVAGTVCAGLFKGNTVRLD